MVTSHALSGTSFRDPRAGNKAALRNSRPSIFETFEQAASLDPTLRVSRAHLGALSRRELRPVSFSRDLMFSSMQKGMPLLVDDLQVAVRREQECGTRDAVLGALSEGFPQNQKIRVRCGPSGEQRLLVVKDLLRRWTGTRARTHVTDWHIRGTGVSKHIDCSQLSDFNLLAGARGEPGAQEMLTMVVSSAGALSDSHSDDPDGSNHCFRGRKLWLVWDTFVGLSRDLEDVSRCEVSTYAAFNIESFLSVPGSRWFTIESGQTLFLPGHLTHKVVTLDDYLGVGSFFVMLPSYLRTLIRWTRHTPLWALSAPEHRRLDLVNQITRLVLSKVRALEGEPEKERSRWGINYLQSAVEEWWRTCSDAGKQELLDNRISAELVRSVLPKNTGIRTYPVLGRRVAGLPQHRIPQSVL
jgi:hypothetical protein